MREYPFLLRDPLVNGLAPDNKGTRNLKYLETLKNLRCRDNCASALEPVSQAPWGSGYVTSWPFPHVHGIEDGGGIVFGSATLGVWDGTSTTATTTAVYDCADPSTVFTPTGNALWMFTSIRDLWIAANGTTTLWYFPFNAPKIVGATLACAAVGRHGNRMFLGGLSGSWFNESTNARWSSIMTAWRKTQPVDRLVTENTTFGANWVIWSERGGGAQDVPYHMLMVMLGVYGTTAFDTYAEHIISRIESGEIGLMPVGGCGTVRSIKSLGNRVMVYGSNAICTLFPDDQSPRYADRIERAQGIHNGAACAGDDSAHLILLDSHELAMVTSEGVEPIGFRHIFSALNGNLFHYDPGQREWWLGNNSGSGYLFNGKALSGPHSVCPTGVARRGGTLWVTAPQIPSTVAIEVKTCAFNLLDNGFKHATEVYVDSEDISGMTARIDWRVGDGAFTAGPEVPCSPEHVAFPRTSFVDGKVRIAGTAGTSASINGIGVRFHDEDKRFRRGPKGSAATDEQTDA